MTPAITLDGASLSLSLSLRLFTLLAASNYTTATMFTPLVHRAVPASENETFLLCHAGKSRAWWRTATAAVAAAVATTDTAAAAAAAAAVAVAVAAEVRVIPNRAA